VLRRGAVVATTAPEEATLTLGESGRKIDFLAGGLEQRIEREHFSC